MLASIANTVSVATVTNPRLGGITGVGAASVAASATDAYALRVENLNVYYGKFRAVMDVSLNIEARRITALIGPSGCGKSTVLRCFNRMNDLIPTARVEGNVEFRGKNLYAPDVDAVEVRRRVGMVFQRANPFPKSIYENIAWGAKINGYRGNMEELVEQSLRVGRAVGRREGQVEPERLLPLRRTAAAALYRPRHRHSARYHPDG